MSKKKDSSSAVGDAIEKKEDIKAEEVRKNKIELLKKFNELFKAETWAKNWAESMSNEELTPITNFEINIMMAKILAASALEIMEIWPKVYDRIAGNNEDWFGEEPKLSESKLETGFGDFADIGFISYFAYTEQALVSAVSAVEIYLKDRFIYSLKLDQRRLRRFSEKQVKIKQLMDIGQDISGIVAELIAEGIPFQKLDAVQDAYNKIYGFEPFSDEELEKLVRIFETRHLIVHKAGIADKKFISITESKFDIGNRIYLERKEVVEMINDIKSIITNLESKLTERDTKRRNE